MAGVLAAAAAGLILMRAAGASAQAGAADPAPALYRRQLSEIDDLAERGLMGEAERAAAHAEAGRRLLAATDAPSEPWAVDPGARRMVLLAVVAVPALALGLYLKLGAPGIADQPYAMRLAQWRQSDLNKLGAPEIAAVLRGRAERPNDAEGFRLLGLARTPRRTPSPGPPCAGPPPGAERPDVWLMLGRPRWPRPAARSTGRAGAFTACWRWPATDRALLPRAARPTPAPAARSPT